MQGDFGTYLVAKTTTLKDAVGLCTLMWEESVSGRRRRKHKEWGPKQGLGWEAKEGCVGLQPHKVFSL